VERLQGTRCARQLIEHLRKQDTGGIVACEQESTDLVTCLINDPSRQDVGVVLETQGEDAPIFDAPIFDAPVSPVGICFSNNGCERPPHAPGELPAFPLGTWREVPREIQLLVRVRLK
jgi:hypothetical protein